MDGSTASNGSDVLVDEFGGGRVFGEGTLTWVPQLDVPNWNSKIYNRGKEAWSSNLSFWTPITNSYQKLVHLFKFISWLVTLPSRWAIILRNSWIARWPRDGIKMPVR